MAKEAEKKNDPRWMEVLRRTTSGMPSLASLLPADFVAVFVAGGAKALRDLRQTDMKGSSPSPFCKELQSFTGKVLQAGGAVGATGHGTRGLPVLSPEEAVSCADRLFSGEFDSAATGTVEAMMASVAGSRGSMDDS